MNVCTLCEISRLNRRNSDADRLLSLGVCLIGLITLMVDLPNIPNKWGRTTRDLITYTVPLVNNKQELLVASIGGGAVLILRPPTTTIFSGSFPRHRFSYYPFATPPLSIVITALEKGKFIHSHISGANLSSTVWQTRTRKPWRATFSTPRSPST